MMSIQFPDVKAGTYRILSNVEFEGNNLLVVKRGLQIQLILVPLELLKVVDRPGEHDTVFEVKEAGGYRVPSSRPTKSAQELNDIDSYTPPGGAVR